MVKTEAMVQKLGKKAQSSTDRLMKDLDAHFEGGPEGQDGEGRNEHHVWKYNETFCEHNQQPETNRRPTVSECQYAKEKNHKTLNWSRIFEFSAR
jgi:hypothetical protein